MFTSDEQTFSSLVPTLRVGTPSLTLCVECDHGEDDAERQELRSHAERGNESRVGFFSQRKGLWK